MATLDWLSQETCRRVRSGSRGAGRMEIKGGQIQAKERTRGKTPKLGQNQKEGQGRRSGADRKASRTRRGRRAGLHEGKRRNQGKEHQASTGTMAGWPRVTHRRGREEREFTVSADQTLPAEEHGTQGNRRTENSLLGFEHQCSKTW